MEVRLYYFQGKYPVPVDKYIGYAIDKDTLRIFFKEGSFKGGNNTKEYVYNSHEEALEDIGLFLEWWGK